MTAMGLSDDSIVSPGFGKDVSVLASSHLPSIGPTSPSQAEPSALTRAHGTLAIARGAVAGMPWGQDLAGAGQKVPKGHPVGWLSGRIAV